MALKKRPNYRAYTVEDIDAETSWWTNIGVAFAHEDKKGMNILLRALPTDGRLVLRKYTEPTSDKETQLPEVNATVKSVAEKQSADTAS